MKIFNNYQGFDLANFNNYQYPLSEVHTYKILKSETYGVFKENISQDFNIPSDQLRLWILVNRQNKTIRPDCPIPESYSNISNNKFDFSLFKIFIIIYKLLPY
jgi:hypothetical protein